MNIASVLDLTHDEYLELHAALQSAKTTEYMQEQVLRLEAKEEVLVALAKCLVEVLAAKRIIAADLALKLNAGISDLDSAPARRRLVELLRPLQSKSGKH